MKGKLVLTGWKDSLALRVVIVGASLAVIVAGLKFSAPILSPILFSLFLAVLCLPILRRLQKWSIPNWLALLVILLGLVIFLVLLGLFIRISLRDLDKRIPIYQRELQDLLIQVQSQLQQLGIDVNGLGLTSAMNTSDLFHTISGFLNNAVESLTTLFLIILGIVFAMLEASSFAAKLRQSSERARAALEVATRFSAACQQFFYLKALNNVIVAAGATIFLFFYRIDFALLWGILIFFLSYIPNIGIIIACIPPVFLALLHHGLLGAVIVIVVLFVINLIGDNVITPRLMGSGLNISQSVIFFSFIFWTWLFGALGALISVPLTALVMFVLDASEETRWLATLMSANNGKKPVEPIVTQPKKSEETTR
jgi:predicted PurR-regulated permease PerM